MSTRIIDLVKGGAAPNDTASPLERLMRELHLEMIARFDVNELVKLSPRELGSQLRALLAELLREQPVSLTTEQHAQVVQATLDEILGFGPLERLLSLPDVTDILVNGPHQIYVERKGHLERADASFRDNAHLVHIIRRIVSRVGRRIDESSPLVDARLADGTRVNAVLEPVALGGASLSLRRFSRTAITAEDLIKWGCASREMIEALAACVRGRLNILVSGGTGSGKTTLLNMLSASIPDTQRIVTIEDAAELKLRQEHVVRMETRPPNLEGQGEITTRMLVRNSLRMRPDRIIVGEIRGEEAIDMLQALNTGHDGSMSTVHANSPSHALSRLQALVGLTHGNMSVEAVREIISDAVHLIVHVTRGPDGVRRITSITEVSGFVDNRITLQELYRFRPGTLEDGHLHGVFQSARMRPGFADRLLGHGVRLPAWDNPPPVRG
jgi:pilus assembly protein CpaF